MFKDGFKPRLGCGDTSFWFGPWLADGPLSNLVPFVHVSDSTLPVKGVWSGRNWRMHSWMTPFCDEVVNKLQHTFIWLHKDIDDALVWAEGTSRCCFVASGYLWLLKIRMGGLIQ